MNWLMEHNQEVYETLRGRGGGEGEGRALWTPIPCTPAPSDSLLPAVLLQFSALLPLP